MRYVSLFSGIEAASVAWHTLGWTPIAFAEFDAFPSAVLAHRFPHVPNLGDITAVDWPAFAEQHGPVDLMVGGSPCQAFSVAGARRSLEDARGNLTLEYVRIADALRPRYIVWENVPGVLNTDDNAFGCFLGALVGADSALVPAAGGRWTNCGVVVGPRRRAAWRVIDAQYIGVAQRRRRVFVVACPTGGADPASVLLEPEGLCWDPAPCREPGARVAGTLEARASTGGYDPGAHGAASGHLIPAVAHTLRAEGFDASEDGTGRGTPIVPCRMTAFGEYVDDDTASTTKARDYKDATDLVVEAPIVMAPAFSKRPGQQIATRDDDASFALTTGEPPRVLAYRKSARAQTSPEDGGFETWVDDDVANTINCFDQGGERDTHAVVEPVMAVRRLTPIECERLQGFPDDWTRTPIRTYDRRRITKARPEYRWDRNTDGTWTLYAADGPRYKACGNSMAVPVMRWIGSRIAAVDAGSPPDYSIPSAFRDEIEGREAR